MEFSVPKETAEKYIDLRFKSYYTIDEKLQPHFWDAVVVLCEDIDADVSKLIDEEKTYCLPYYDRDANWGRGGWIHLDVSELEGNFSTATSLAKHIANLIIEEEKKGPVSRAEFYAYQKKVEYLLEKANYVDPSAIIYG